MYHAILAINLHVHVLWLPVAMILSVLAGMLFRSAQLKKAKNQLVSLENEMMNNHAEILRLQRELAVEKSSPKPVTPVVPLTDPRPEEKDKPDLAKPNKV